MPVSRRSVLLLACMAICALCLALELWHYGFACRNLACRLRRNPWLAARYDPGVPPYLTPANAEGVLMNLETDAQRAAVSAMLAKLEKPVAELENRREADLAGKDQPRSCAVVGNADNLLGSGYGPLIDGHALVFRMNNPPLKGFEKDVGKRTSYHVIHTYFTVIDHYEKNTITVLISDNINKTYQSKRIPRGLPGFDDYTPKDLAWMSWKLAPEMFAQAAIPAEVTAFPKNIGEFAGALRLMHPDFVYYIADRWFTPERRWKLDLSSTGFKTIILALHLCDSVDLFGFGAMNQQSRWPHYWDMHSNRNAQAHRPDFQELFIDEMEKRGAFRRYRGVAHAQEPQP